MALDVDRTLSDPVVDHRLRTAVDVAGDLGTGVGLGELSDLLPSRAFAGGDAVADWFRRHPRVGEVRGERVFAHGTSASVRPEDSEARRRRGERYLAGAAELLLTTLAPVLPLLRTVGVTGSVAYGEPEAGDDCDFFVVTRDGAMWVFLAYVYLKLRLRPLSLGADSPRAWCFNFVLEDTEARATFARPQGFLFAREALTLRLLRGGPEYRSLLAAAPWLKQEAPRLHARWEPIQPHEAHPPPPTPVAIRVLNTLLYPVLGAYLQAVGLLRNRRYRRAGRLADTFRTETAPRRLAVLSVKFDRLTDRFRRASDVSPG